MNVGVLAFIATLVLMIMIHELGHLLTAKWAKMKVEEYFLGFGPRLFSFKKGETEYGVKAILLGGYVRIAGMNPWQPVPDSDVARTFGARPAWQRAIVLSAGSFTHLVLGFLILTIMYGVVGLQDPSRPKPVIDSVDYVLNGKPGPAKSAGLKEGDRIVSVDGVTVESWDQVRSVIRSSADTAIVFEVERNGAMKKVSVTPVATDVPVDPQKPKVTERVGQVGILPAFQKKRLPPLEAVGQGFTTTAGVVVQSVKAIPQIFSPSGLSKVFGALNDKGTRSVDQPVGPVGIARVSGQAAAAGAEELIFVLTFFIVFVGVINLVPLPPFDGGHLLILALEKTFGRKIDMRKVVPVTSVVLGFFLVLTVTLLYLDIFRPVANPFQ